MKTVRLLLIAFITACTFAAKAQLPPPPPHPPLPHIHIGAPPPPPRIHIGNPPPPPGRVRVNVRTGGRRHYYYRHGVRHYRRY